MPGDKFSGATSITDASQLKAERVNSHLGSPRVARSALNAAPKLMGWRLNRSLSSLRFNSRLQMLELPKTCECPQHVFIGNPDGCWCHRLRSAAYVISHYLRRSLDTCFKAIKRRLAFHWSLCFFRGLMHVVAHHQRRSWISTDLEHLPNSTVSPYRLYSGPGEICHGWYLV